MVSRSVSPTNFEVPASPDKGETQSKGHRCGKSQTPKLVNSWKENFKLTLCTNSQSVWAEIKVSVVAAEPAKSIWHCTDKIENLKDTCKQAKDNNKKSG